MSSKKITDADKLEIVDLYRQSGDTTASLAIRYGVSNSTISRLLKTSIPETEYETLIQQKRGSKVGNEAESLVMTDNPSAAMPTAIPPELEIDNGTSQPNSFPPNREDPAPVAQIFLVEGDASPPASTLEDSSAKNNRRVRRRSSAPLNASFEPIAVESLSITGAEAEIELPIVKTPAGISVVAISISGSVDAPVTDLPTPTIVSPPIPRTPVLREILSDSKDRYATPPVVPLPVAEISIDEIEEEDSEPEDVNALAAMFGEEVADDDDDDDDSEDDDAATDSSSQQLDRNKFLTEDRLHVQVTPLSQATLPRTCYIVIDKFAELIVRPLKDFADLGQISGDEIQQRTLPVFDNHRVAKRFSNQRTQRVIKVPDSRVFHKTTQHLRSKGITRLLVDGNIYSLN